MKGINYVFVLIFLSSFSFASCVIDWGLENWTAHVFGESDYGGCTDILNSSLSYYVIEQVYHANNYGHIGFYCDSNNITVSIAVKLYHNPDLECAYSSDESRYMECEDLIYHYIYTSPQFYSENFTMDVNGSGNFSCRVMGTGLSGPEMYFFTIENSTSVVENTPIPCPLASSYYIYEDNYCNYSFLNDGWISNRVNQNNVTCEILVVGGGGAGGGY